MLALALFGARHGEKLVAFRAAQGEYLARLREFEAGRGTIDILLESLRLRLFTQIALDDPESAHVRLYEECLRLSLNACRLHWGRYENGRIPISDPAQERQQFELYEQALVEAVVKERRRQLRRPTHKEIAALWDELASPDPVTGLKAYASLLASPSETTGLLRERLPAGSQIEEWINQLDSDRYAVRQAATEHLAKNAVVAEASLRKRLATGPCLETRRRIEQILLKLDGPEEPSTWRPMLLALKPEQRRLRLCVRIETRLALPPAAPQSPPRITR
jgi:hypothetical protein